jgi:predicted HTH transcriptional regulator
MISLMKTFLDNPDSHSAEFYDTRRPFQLEEFGTIFSALSNEAALLGRKCGWLILGVDPKQREITGARLSEGLSLSNIREAISPGLASMKLSPSYYDTGRLGEEIIRPNGLNIEEIFEVSDNSSENPKKALIFKIPAALPAAPTVWKSMMHCRFSRSLETLSLSDRLAFASLGGDDKSQKIIPKSGVKDLNITALIKARKNHALKLWYNGAPKSSVQDAEEMSNLSFLRKINLMDGRYLRDSAFTLLGSPSSDKASGSNRLLVLREFNRRNRMVAQTGFDLPFYTLPDRIIHFLYKRRLFFGEESNHLKGRNNPYLYDPSVIRELINNAIAFHDYESRDPIFFDLYFNRITIVNSGYFLPLEMHEVIRPGWKRAYDMNRNLREAMRDTYMIKDEGKGIRRILEIQRANHATFPDFDFNVINEVAITIRGGISKDKKLLRLYDRPDIGIEDLFIADRARRHSGLLRFWELFRLEKLGLSSYYKEEPTYIYCDPQLEDNGYPSYADYGFPEYVFKNDNFELCYDPPDYITPKKDGAIKRSGGIKYPGINEKQKPIKKKKKSSPKKKDKP